MPDQTRAKDVSLRRLLTTAEVADILGTSTRTVRRFAADGRLTPIRIGSCTTRYDPADVEHLIASSRVRR